MVRRALHPFTAPEHNVASLKCCVALHAFKSSLRVWVYLPTYVQAAAG